MTATLTATGVSVTFRRRLRVLDGVALTCAAGEAVGIAGASGSGKSTLLRVLTGLLQPDAGEVLLALTAGGEAVPPARARTRAPGAMGVIAQAPLASLDPLWSITRIVGEPLRCQRVDRSERRERVPAALADVGLGAIDPEARPRSLSVGQAQRVALARALVGTPRLIVADEPTSALDATTSAAIARRLRAAVDGGGSLVIASHDSGLLGALCDRVVHVRDGRLA